MKLSYSKFKRIFGDLGITEWVKFNWLSNAGIARQIYNKVVEAGYNPLAYVNAELYNHIEEKKFLVLVGSVDLGTLDWYINNISLSLSVFSSTDLLNLAKPVDAQSNANILCARYKVNPRANVVLGKYDKTIAIGGVGTFGTFLTVCDTSYTNATAFKQAMSGVILYYELATPILIDI